MRNEKWEIITQPNNVWESFFRAFEIGCLRWWERPTGSCWFLLQCIPLVRSTCVWSFWMQVQFLAKQNGPAVRGHPYMTSSKFSGFWTPSPLVWIWDWSTVLNSRNLTYYIFFWANPPPPSVRTSYMDAPLSPDHYGALLWSSICSALWEVDF